MRNADAVSLIDHDAGAVPLVAVSKAGLARGERRRRASDWVAATGFAGEAGKLALIPDDGEGRPGAGRDARGGRDGGSCRASDALPEGSYHRRHAQE
jgi:hypothetical protein